MFWLAVLVVASVAGIVAAFLAGYNHARLAHLPARPAPVGGGSVPPVPSDEYPPDDSEFYDRTLTGVVEGANDYTLKFGPAMCLTVWKPTPVRPEPGMTVRFYGRGLGCVVRGVFLNGRRCHYRPRKSAFED